MTPGGDRPDPRAAAAGPAPAGERRRGRILARLEIDRLDVYLMGALLVVAFVFRYFSPLMPGLLTHPLRGPVLTNCVPSTPVDARNDLGTLCGLAYPYQRNYASGAVAALPPQGQVFDEIYFGVFAHDDLKGISYFDPEPPLSKEMIAAGEWLYGWWRATFQGAAGSYADLGFNTYGWRLMVCVFGSLCVPLMYLFAIQLWRERWFAFAAATLACFDGMFFVQSRIGMIDIFPIFLIMLAYTSFLVHLKARTERDALVTLVITGVACGLAVASKWIALAAMFSIVMFLILRPLTRFVRLTLGEGRSWSWGLLPGPALPGGARGGRYLAAGLAAFIVLPVAIYIASWFPFFMRGQFHNLSDLIAYNRQAYIYHATLTATHPYGSKWFTWPFLYRPVAYYYEYQSLGNDTGSGRPLVAGIVNLGNPLIWWASIPAVLSLPYFILRHRSWPALLILVGFLTQYLPWARISRVVFLYHMFGGLIFMVLALAFVLTRIQKAGPLRIEFFEDRWRIPTGWVVPAFLVAVVALFLYFYPVWTALPISDTSYLSQFPAGKMWFRTWI